MFFLVYEECNESRKRETVTFSPLFRNTKDKMVQIFFSTSPTMHFYNIRKYFSKKMCFRVFLTHFSLKSTPVSETNLRTTAQQKNFMSFLSLSYERLYA